MASLTQDMQYERYLQEVTRHPLLTPEEELELAYRVRDGDEAARERLVASNLRFVLKVAFQYRRYRVPFLDIIQEGNLGLMKAVEKFDPDRGFRLVTYAVHWIRAYIRAYILRAWSVVRVGTTHAERRLFYRLPRARRELAASIGDDPQVTLAALAEHLDATPEQVARAQLRLYGRDVSLAAPLRGVEDDDISLEDTLPADDVLEDEVDDREELGVVRDAIERALESLDDRQRYIVRQRLLTDDAKTLSTLGDELGISRERVRQLEVEAKKRMVRAFSDSDRALFEGFMERR